MGILFIQINTDLDKPSISRPPFHFTFVLKIYQFSKHLGLFYWKFEKWTNFVKNHFFKSQGSVSFVDMCTAPILSLKKYRYKYITGSKIVDVIWHYHYIVLGRMIHFFSLTATAKQHSQPQTKQLLLKSFCNWLQIRSSPMFWSYYIKADLFSKLSSYKTSANFEFATNCKMVLIKDTLFEFGNLVLAVAVKLKILNRSRPINYLSI